MPRVCHIFGFTGHLQNDDAAFVSAALRVNILEPFVKLLVINSRFRERG